MRAKQNAVVFFATGLFDPLQPRFQGKLQTPRQEKGNFSQSRRQFSGDHFGARLPLRPPKRISNEWLLTGFGAACHNKDASAIPGLPPARADQTVRGYH